MIVDDLIAILETGAGVLTDRQALCDEANEAEIDDLQDRIDRLNDLAGYVREAEEEALRVETERLEAEGVK